jgi:hypothetical protein
MEDNTHLGYFTVEPQRPTTELGQRRHPRRHGDLKIPE